VKKKKQKDFCFFGSVLAAPPRPIGKSLLLLFFRKEDLAFL
jgi:hypothetical protein